ERPSSERPGERGDEPQGHRDQCDRQEVRGRLSDSDPSAQDREEPVVQKERDPSTTTNPRTWARPARSIDRPQAGTPFGPSGGKPLPRPRTAKVIFDRSDEGLAHGPIPGDVRMETIRGSPQAVRIPGLRDGGVGIAEQDPED